MSVRLLFSLLPILFASIVLLAQDPELQSTDQSFPPGVIQPGTDIQTEPGMIPTDVSAGGYSTGSIAGSIVTIDGRPVRDSEVDLHDQNTGAVVATTYTRINGSFEFENVPVGRYEVVATHGVDSAREQLNVEQGSKDVTLRMNTPQPEPGSGDTISVAALQAPQKAKNEFHKGTEAFMKKKYAEAEKHADKALSIAPYYAQALTLRGLVRLGTGQVSAGEADFERSITNDPNYGLAYFALGAALNTEAKFSQAQRTLEEGLRIEPTSWQGYFELSKSVLGQHDFRDALKYVVKTESFGVNYAPIHLVKAHALLGLKDYDEAASELERYLSSESTGPQADEARRALSQARAFTTTAEK
jgi:Tfp pilus assembly protein PilF